MKDIPDSTLISDINIPGTHDACAKHVALPHFTKCQNKTIAELLDIGVRLFDIRIEKREEKLVTVHSIITCRKSLFGEPVYFDDVFNACLDFLRRNPSETIILSIKRDNGPDGVTTFNWFYDKFIRGNSCWYTDAAIPTLGNVRGKLILFNRTTAEGMGKDEAGLDFTAWEQMSPEEAGNPVIKKFPLTDENYIIQDLYKLHPARKWEIILSLLNWEAPEKMIAINYLSGNDAIHSPRVYSRFINRKFMRYPLVKGKKYGWFFIDYAKYELTKKITESNKGK